MHALCSVYMNALLRPCVNENHCPRDTTRLFEYGLGILMNKFEDDNYRIILLFCVGKQCIILRACAKGSNFRAADTPF